MTESEILQIAKKSSKELSLPKRPMFKKFRILVDDIMWAIKMSVLWVLVKIGLFDFYQWQTIAFNRVRKFEE